MDAGEPTATIYGLVDPRSNRVRYVGKTTWSLAHRLKGHLAEVKAQGHTHKSRWIAGLLAEGLRPSVIVLERVPVSDWEEAECRWIARLEDLTNVTAGGEVGGWGWQAGEQCPSAKLTEADVVTICKRYVAGGVTQTVLAAEYGLTVSGIARIVRGDSWKHVVRPTVKPGRGAPGVSRRGGSPPRGELNFNAKLTPETVREMRSLYAAGHNQQALASRFGVCQATVSSMLRGETWSHV